MTRRDFLLSCRASLALPFLNLPAFLKTEKMGIVVHSYGTRWQSTLPSEKYPGFKNAIDLLEHCHRIGVGGIQVQVHDWALDFSRQVRSKREKFDMFLEGSVSLPRTKEDVPRFEQDLAAAAEAGASIVRTVCLSGRRYENLHSLDEFKRFTENSINSLRLAEPAMRRRRMYLAIENHKDWRAAELADMLSKIDSEWIGVNLDFGNNIALIEEPMEVIEKLAPYTFTTHVKDMGVKEYERGFLLSEVPLGDGILNLKAMFDICKKHKRQVHFNLEMITRDPLKIPCLDDAFWATMPEVRGRELASTLSRVREQSFPGDLPTVSGLTGEGRLEQEEQNILKSLAYCHSVIASN